MARSGALPERLAAARPRSGIHRGSVQALWVQAAVREPLAVWLLTRLLFVVLTYFGVILFGSVLHGPHPSFTHQLLPAWGTRWDTVWYIQIAQRGYNWHRPAGTSPTAFFPLYPLVIRVLVTLTHRSYALSALLIANVTFLGALLYLWRLTSWEWGREVAGRAVLYIAIFPTALFFFAGYTESLFLFFTVASFYHLRREDWLLAGVFGGLAAATRVTGILLVLPLLYEYLRSRNFSPRRLDVGLLTILLVPAGLAAFMVYLQANVGDALAFTHSQVGWQKLFTGRLWAGTLESLRQIFVVQPRASFLQAHNVFNLVLGIFCLGCSILAARRLPLAYGLYLGVFWLVTLASPALATGYPVPLVSLSRYVVILFPVFMYLGAGGRNRTIHDTYLVLSVGLLALFTVQFITGGWVV
ncbi:MAG: mannosyltransferase family protein [Chloroflexota bacterium]